jgi:hypothetical protein
MTGEASLRRFIVPFALLALLVAASGYADSHKKPLIADIGGQVRGREARVKFTLQNAFTPEMVEALKSGIDISFKTVVRVERVHRKWFFNTVMAEQTFSRSVRYDAISRVYRINQGGKEEHLPDINAAISGMTRYEVSLPLFIDVERGKKYRALVKTRLDKVGLSEPLRSFLLFSSYWDVETDWGKGDLVAP